MKGFGLCLAILGTAIVSSVYGYTPEYYLDQYCGNTIFVSSAAILKLNNYQSPSPPCTVSVKSTFHYSSYENKVRLDVKSLHVPCGNDYVQFYDGPTANNPLSGRLACTDYVYQTDYVTSSSDTLTIVIYADYYSSDASLKLLATGTAQYDYQANDFVCNNNYDIDSSLKCDGNNNCGDWSDEDSFLCGDNDWFEWPIKTAVIVGGCSLFVFILLIVLAVVLVRRRRRNLNAQYQNLANPSQPYYGSIQGGAAGPPGAYMPAPPPYTKSGPPAYPYPQNPYGAMPPPPPFSATPQAGASTTVTTTTETATTAVESSAAPTST